MIVKFTDSHLFQEKSKRTQQTTLDWKDQFANAALGLAGEAIEYLRSIIDGETKEASRYELGDALFYAAYLATLLELELSEADWTYAMWGTPEDMARELVVKAGSVAELSKKVLFHGKPLEEYKAKIDAALVEFINAADCCAKSVGVQLSTIYDMNIDKLLKRHPGGFKPDSNNNN